MTNDMKKPMKNRIYLQRFLWFWLFIFQACDMDIQSSDVKSSMPRASQIDTWNMKMDEVLKEAEERKLGNWSRFKWCVKETTCKNVICLSVAHCGKIPIFVQKFYFSEHLLGHLIWLFSQTLGILKIIFEPKNVFYHSVHYYITTHWYKIRIFVQKIKF